MGSSCGIMANLLDFEFELQLCYDVHIWTNTLWKGMNPFIPSMG